jgi:hypothetical protein
MIPTGKKRDAGRTLSVIETQLMHDDWGDPKKSAVKLAGYVEQWVRSEPGCGRAPRSSTGDCCEIRRFASWRNGIK